MNHICLEGDCIEFIRWVQIFGKFNVIGDIFDYKEKTIRRVGLTTIDSFEYCVIWNTRV